MIRSTMEYADIVWDGCLIGEKELLESVQLQAALEQWNGLTGRAYSKKRLGKSWKIGDLFMLVVMYKIVNKQETGLL